MMITPSATVAGHRITQTLGLVRGNTIRARHVGKDIVAGFRKVSEYTKMMAESREQALDRMMAEAEELGAHAIVCVRFATSYVMGSASEILAYGDAVKLEKEPEVTGF